QLNKPLSIYRKTQPYLPRGTNSPSGCFFCFKKAFLKKFEKTLKTVKFCQGFVIVGLVYFSHSQGEIRSLRKIKRRIKQRKTQTQLQTKTTHLIQLTKERLQ
ncbi:MAG: hypothetical protein II190_03420, partial [Ruminococcus sp.]|nr:hypothetical protein [Ruminococcus sp.]